MKTLLISCALLSACNGSKNAAVTPAAGFAEPGKGAIAHYCSQMPKMTAESLKGVPPARAQAGVAARMSEAARVTSLSDWGSFEAWLERTEPSDRQAALDKLIQKHGLESDCRSVSSAAIR